MKYVRPERIWMKQSKDFSEQWVEDRIKEDPTIIGLGDVTVLGAQRTQPAGGRLDLLLADTDHNRRYEVELQLGATDESHIIRTIEYWDVERRRYPNHDHTAVIIAEDITSRFLNVISLFNGTVPLIAFQMQAMKVGDVMTLIFTRVLDELRLGTDMEDEPGVVTDRAYWEKQAAPATVAIADQLLEIVNVYAPNLELKYNKQYIGLAQDGIANNFVAFEPKRKSINLNLRLPVSADVDQIVVDADFEMLAYDRSFGNYRLKLTETDMKSRKDAITELISRAYKNNTKV